MKKWFLIASLFLALPCFSQVNIVPAPAEIKMGSGTFAINLQTNIVLEGSGLEKIAAQLAASIKKITGYDLKIKKGIAKDIPPTNRITLNYERLDYEFSGAYTMQINSKEVYIAGDNAAGVFYGTQSLLQLIAYQRFNQVTYSTGTNKISSGSGMEAAVPQLSIDDHPRFAYRGAHLDVCRHFFSVAEIKQYIDYLAAYKFNTFHWHLTDDQGWRIEIKKYPLLTSVGGYRNGTIIGRYPGKGNDSLTYGGYYTQLQIKEVVKYAADRYIDVIPEIEMPGHASAAIAAYPQLSCFPEEDTKIPDGVTWAGSHKGKQVQQAWGVFEDVFAPTDYTFNFLQDVIDEVLPLFPSNYIHIGGDECPKDSWKRSAFCQQLIKEKKLGDEHGLQSYFISRMEKYINKKGKKIIGWDEILEGGLAPNATVMSWRGIEGGIAAAKEKHAVIMTPQEFCYLDHSQSRNEDSVTIGGYLPVEKVYSYEPVAEALNKDEQKFVQGAQVNVWTEYIGNPSKLQYTIFPRMIAFSEVLWSPKEKRNWKDFERRLGNVFIRLDDQGINSSKAYYDLKASVLPADSAGVIWLLQSVVDREGINMIEARYRDRKQYSKDGKMLRVNITESGTAVGSFTCDCDERTDSHTPLAQIKQEFFFNLATAKHISLAYKPSEKYPGSGGFTLVDGVQNKMGLVRSSEFLGYQGGDMEAIIDLGKPMFINEMKLHVFEQVNSWIYRPESVSFYSSADTLNFKLLETVKDASGKANLVYTTKLTEPARFIKIVAKNAGVIAEGKPGAGSKAWLFVDEVEIQ